MKPYRQGDLDGLCGLYATINATRLTGCPISVDYGIDLLLEAVFILNKKPVRFITEGTNVTDLSKVIRDCICQEFNIKRSKPFHKKANVDLDEFWRTLAVFLNGNPNRSAIICFGTKTYSHWTVVKEITNNRIYLFDSDQRVHINRNQCSITEVSEKTPTIIFASATFFLEKL